MTFTERYRKQCNPMNYDLLDVMAGSRGIRREQAKYIAPTPSRFVAGGIVVAVTVLTLCITVLAIVKVR